MSSIADLILDKTPVDPNDPTKGVKTEVADAATLTARTNNLRERTEVLLELSDQAREIMRDAFTDIGRLLEAIVSDLQTEFPDMPLSPVLTEFMEQREELRAQYEQEQYEAQETNSEEGGELDEDFAAGEASWTSPED